jgi:hypothetical protein
MTITAIPTRYKGCRMRSRLEARWAVFFDVCEISWQYELQGLNVKLGRRGRGLNWLPDFELETGQLVEVKGSLDSAALARLLTIASEVAKCGPGQDIVVLGNVPRPDDARWPVQLHSHRGLWAVPWDLMTGCPLDRPGPKVDLIKKHADIVRDWLLNGMPGHREPSWAHGALARARGARFEHGESG